MSKHETLEHCRPRDGHDDLDSRKIWGHSLSAAAVCIGAGATIVLVAIFGQPG
jgi:hypothetical protein